MLTIPSVLNVDDVVVFPCDEDPERYYLLSTTPRIRMREDGTPALSGLFWTDKADGSSESTAGLAGGWINFDVNLAISEEKKNKIAKLLKSSGIPAQRRKEIMKIERERLALRAKAQGKDAYPDPEIPMTGEVHFGAIQFTEGKVVLLEEQDGELVEWSSGSGEANKLGDNNAAFALRLGPDGAAIWYKALRQGDKAIGVRYEMTFPVRLESLEIIAYAGSTQKLELDRKVERVWENVDKGCTNADVERINVSEIRESLMEEGLINIEVKKGSSQISEEHVGQLRNMMMGIIENKLKEVIKNRMRGITEEERKSSMISMIREEYNAFVDLRFKQSDVIDWEIAPQATISGFLDDIPEDKKKRVAILVDLSDPEVGTVEIPIQVDAPWDEAPFVNAVKVNCSYPSAGEKTSYIFKKSSATEIWRMRRPDNDDGEVIYQAEVYFKGRSNPYIMPARKTNGAINVQVGKVGLVNMNFIPNPVLASLSGDNRLLSIQVDVNYKDESAEDHFATSVVMTPAEVEGKKLERFLGGPIDAPIEYTVSYLTKENKRIEMAPRKYYLGEGEKAEVYTPSPFEDTLELAVETAITPDQSLKKIIVEFIYEDPENEFESVEKVVMSEDDDWEPVVARLVQLDKEKKKFQYRYKVISENSVSRSNWIQGSGDQTIILPILPVMVDVSRLGIGSDFYTAIIDLQYEEEENDLMVNDQMFIMDGDDIRRFTWYIPRMDPNKDTFRYSLTLYPMSGAPITYENLEAKGRFLVLRQPEEV
ncbi:MAG: hypothetical protein R2824_01830 [Saprospiraceae bacterium]|nr:hypothetical protein [Lewinella sp.]